MVLGPGIARDRQGPCDLQAGSALRGGRGEGAGQHSARLSFRSLGWVQDFHLNLYVLALLGRGQGAQRLGRSGGVLPSAARPARRRAAKTSLRSRPAAARPRPCWL